MIVISLLIEMSICVSNGNQIVAYLLNITYGVELNDKAPVIVIALPIFLALITVPRLPHLTVFSVLALVSLIIQMVIQIVICFMDKVDNAEVALFGGPRYIPELVSCLLMGTGSFPVVSFLGFLLIGNELGLMVHG